jgi:DNA polymerase III subunit epsilon
MSSSDRATAVRWAQEILQQTNVYILDTETTGTSKRDEVVQIGIIDTQGAVVMDTLVRATIPMTSGASAVNGITDDLLADAPTYADLYVALSSALAGGTLIAYNVSFDWRMLEQTRARYRLPALRVKHRDCAMKRYATYRGVRRGRNGYRWHKLTQAVAHEQLTVTDAHTALGDVKMTLALIRKMAES